MNWRRYVFILTTKCISPIAACGEHSSSDAWMFQLNFGFQMKRVAVLFPPTNLDPHR